MAPLTSITTWAKIFDDGNRERRRLELRFYSIIVILLPGYSSRARIFIRLLDYQVYLKGPPHVVFVNKHAQIIIQYQGAKIYMLYKRLYEKKDTQL